MRIFKDNRFDRILEQIRPAAILNLIFVSIVILAGVLLAMVSDPSAIKTLALMVPAAVFFLLMVNYGSTRILRNEMGAVSARHLEPAVKWPTEKKLIAAGINVNVGGSPTILGSQNVATPFPFGAGYRTIFLEFNISVTIGTGTGAITEGELLFIKNIYMKTDKHGAVIDNVCGRALFKRAQVQMKTAPYKDAVAASTAVYNVSIPLHFVQFKNRRPEDTILNMKNVKSLELDITLGSVADLFTSVGTSSVTCTVDISVEKTKNEVNIGNAPQFQPYLAMLGPVDPSILQYLEVPKIADLGVEHILVWTSNSAAAGVPFSGTASNNTISRFTYEDNKTGKTFDSITAQTLQNDNKLKFQMETKVAGLFVIDTSEEDSIWGAYGAGDKAKLQINWVNGTLSTSQVSALIEGVVQIKQAAA